MATIKQIIMQVDFKQHFWKVMPECKASAATKWSDNYKNTNNKMDNVYGAVIIAKPISAYIRLIC